MKDLNKAENINSITLSELFNSELEELISHIDKFYYLEVAISICQTSLKSDIDESYCFTYKSIAEGMGLNACSGLTSKRIVSAIKGLQELNYIDNYYMYDKKKYIGTTFYTGSIVFNSDFLLKLSYIINNIDCTMFKNIQKSIGKRLYLALKLSCMTRSTLKFNYDTLYELLVMGKDSNHYHKKHTLKMANMDLLEVGYIKQVKYYPENLVYIV